MPLQEPSPYEVLGVARDADDDEIDRAVGAALREERIAAEVVDAAAAALRNPARRLELDAQHLLPPEPVDEAERLLAPLLDEPLPFPARAPLASGDLLAVHRGEVEAQFAQPPAPPAGFPGLPERFAPDLSVLPPIELPR
jgi:hypothetical protein